MAVVIYFNSDKPGEHGAPSYVGSSLGVRDYEKYAWNRLDSIFPAKDVKLTISDSILKIDATNFY